MNQQKEIQIRGILRSRRILLCMGISMWLMTLIGGCSQSPTGLDESEKAAMREVRELAGAAAVLVDEYMDARVTDMLVGSSLGGPLRDALTMPEARADANAILKD